MKTEKKLQYVFAAIVLICIFSLLALLIFKPIPEINKDTANILIGALAASFISIIQYYFGSSKGSADKQEMLNR